MFFSVWFSVDVLAFDSHLRPLSNPPAFQVVAHLRHAAKRMIPPSALFYAGARAVFLDVCPEHNGERQRIPDPG
jgi:hypothetical protein